jgi:hypothetical protein
MIKVYQIVSIASLIPLAVLLPPGMINALQLLAVLAQSI